MVVTNHACQRYMEYVDFDLLNFEDARNSIISFVFNNKHEIISKTNKIIYVLIGELIVIFDKTKQTIITLYPATKSKIKVLKDNQQRMKKDSFTKGRL